MNKGMEAGSPNKRRSVKPPVLSYSEPSITIEFVREAVRDLALNDDTRRDWLVHHLFHQTRNFALGRALEASCLHGEEASMHLKNTVSKLEAARDAVAATDWELTILIGQMLKGRRPQESLQGQRNSLDSLIEAVSEAAADRKPSGKRSRNNAVKLVTGAMMFVLEKATGNRPIVNRKITPDAGGPLTSPEARIIGKLLRSVHPSTPETTIAGSIERVRAAYRGKTLEAFAPMLIVGSPAHGVRPKPPIIDRQL